MIQTELSGNPDSMDALVDLIRTTAGPVSDKYAQGYAEVLSGVSANAAALRNGSAAPSHILDTFASLYSDTQINLSMTNDRSPYFDLPVNHWGFTPSGATITDGVHDFASQEALVKAHPEFGYSFRNPPSPETAKAIAGREAFIDSIGADPLGVGTFASVMGASPSTVRAATALGQNVGDLMAASYVSGGANRTSLATFESATIAGESAIFATRTSLEANAAMESQNYRGAWGGSTVVTELAPSGSQYNMVLNTGQAQAFLEGIPAFGSWATPDTVPDQSFARNDLAILPNMKQDIPFVALVETTAPQMLNRGLVGALDGAAGGANQVEFLGPKNLKIVGLPKPLPRVR